MSLEMALEEYPKDVELKGFACKLRPLEATDELAFHEFFLAVPNQERMFIKHRVTEPEVIRDWCRNIDLGRNLPLLACQNGQIIGDATLHQQLGGWKRHIGRVSVLIHPNFRGRGLAKAMVSEVIDLARQLGLEKLEADTGDLPRKLSPGKVEANTATPIDAMRFAEDLAADPMATEKLRDGIAAFAKELVGLRETIAARLR